MLALHFKQCNHHQKAQKCGNVALSGTTKGTLIYSMELKQDGRASPSLNSTGDSDFFAVLYKSVNDCKNIMVTSKFKGY